jgi:transposase-like protein
VTIAVDELPRVTGRHRNTALARARKARCVELVTQGRTYQQVAIELGYANRGSVYAIVKKALDEHTAESVDDLRRLEVARLDELQSALWDRALSGDAKAVGVIVRIISQRSRLLGLDALGSSDEADLGDTVVVRS